MRPRRGPCGLARRLRARLRAALRGPTRDLEMSDEQHRPGRVASRRMGRGEGRMIFHFLGEKRQPRIQTVANGMRVWGAGSERRASTQEEG
jgi:hypothetical protein